ncbi:MAG: hypothetical protein ALECFALPRED_005402 [Alectoria fallacina]|uniref:NADP-dependent oxidoreductase domain-containing protein n=1 Tax=Alectoria fallacina TaxID=1903189 RepID=A0A8H3IXU0_9LECA|nr:MAG: hypothetical protein ALECFALPRED_005402 [Alectoria fallacina]
MTAPPSAPPKSLLARHRVLAPTAAVHVSPICLGAMNFGNAWKSIMGECSKETAFYMLDYFYEQGGNFIDTANGYQAEESETWLGEWMTKTGRRDEIILATKYTGPYKATSGPNMMQSNFGGNSAKSLHVSVEASLKKLQTSYIDLLYVHYWDMQTCIPEVMQSLNHLVSSRKVLYLGISDTPAWVVVKCNAYARQYGLRQFSVYQGKWSAAERDFERDIIPMCMDEGMSLAPWGALGGGYFKPKEQVGKDGGRNLPHVKAKDAEQVSEVLDKIAKRKGTLVTSVALAYVMHKAPYVFPICGGRKVSHLKGNIEALGLQLSGQDLEEIEQAYPFDVGFPHNMLSGGPHAAKGPEDHAFSKRLGHIDYVKGLQPIPPQAL